MEESELVERVFLRIASTETDEQFESALNKFLAGLLLKLSSTDEAVRKKVMELLVHVNKRLKSRSAIHLPIDLLLQQYSDPANPPMVTNFTIIYIKMGVPRLPLEQQTAVFPRLVQSIQGKPQAHQDSLLQLIVPMVGHLPMPADPPKRKALYGMADAPQARQLLLDLMLDILMLPYSQYVAPPETEASRAPGAKVAVNAPPCFSELSYKRAAGDPQVSAEVLEKTKVGILRFLAADVYPEEAICAHYIVAAADSRHSVATAADSDVRRVTAGVDWNSKPVISALFTIFQGTHVNAKAPGPKPKTDTIKAAAPLRLRMKIFPYLLKSRLAADLFPQNIQITFDCLFGTNTNQKLKLLAVQFVHHMAECSNKDSLRPLGGVLLSSLLRMADSDEAKEDVKLRGAAYTAMGKVVQKLPELAADSAACVQTLFKRLCEEGAEVKISIQDALTMMAPSYAISQSHVKKIVEAISLQYVEKEEPQARMMAVHYAHNVFPTSWPAARFVLLMACGDPKEDIRAEAEKLLHLRRPVALETSAPNGASSGVPVDDLYPSFPEMTAYLHQMAKQRLQSQLKVAVGLRVLAFNASAFAKMLSFLRTCLARSARAVVAAGDTLADLQQQAPAISIYVRSLLQFDLGDAGPVQMYISLLKQFLTAVTACETAYFLLEIIAVAPEKLASCLATDIAWLKELSCCLGDEDVRYLGAQLLAVVAVDGLGHDKALTIFEDIRSSFSTKLTYEKQCGSLLMMAQLVARHALRRRHGNMTVEDDNMDGSRGEPDTQTERWQAATTGIVKLLVQYLSDESWMTLACSALKDVSCTGPLCLEDGSESDEVAVVSKLSITKMLVAGVKNTKLNYKIREKMAVCLGALSVGDEAYPWRRESVRGLLDSITTKELELSFGVGDALVMAALGPSSEEASDHWLVCGDQFRMLRHWQADDDTLGWLLDQLLSKYLVHANPHILQAACVWLLTIVKKCGSRPAVRQRNERTQAAFMQLLSEADEVTQDIASKGLGVTYESSSENDKARLMTLLVEALMTGKRNQREVTSDTQVFEEGALGKTLDGQSMTTYRELCSIASDLNQPDLVYKFMHLANHNSVWNTRKGAAFGFSGLAAQAGKQLTPYLSKIVPRLYRYTFDPNVKVQMAMRSIWNAVVQDAKETVDKYMTDILEDVITHLTDSQWRVRESCCHALNELLKGRPLDDLVDHLPHLWETLLRVRDDIKESVRKAADAACSSLSRATIKVCDLNYGKVGERAIMLVLPTLLQCGLISQVAEIRDISLKTIMSVSKSAGRLLQPHIQLLVPSLLESLSGLEPQQLNYLALRVSATNGQEAQDQLDSMRVAASKMSPMMECINLCIQHVNESSLAQLVPRLTELIRGGIGLGTKVGSANLVVTLVHQCPKDLQPHTGKLLAALVHGLGDRNATIRKAYAVAIGNLGKVAKDESIEKLIAKLRGWYLEKDDEGLLLACGQTLRAMSQSCPDVLLRHATAALPLAFLAMHSVSVSDSYGQHGQTVSHEDAAKRVTRNDWAETWNDMTPGTESGLRLYLDEVLVLVRASLEASSWQRKAVGAAALSSVAQRLGSAIGPPQLDVAVAALLAGLAGRTWNGKEALLEALRMITTSCTDKIRSSSAIAPQQIVDCALKEVKKESVGAAYRAAALHCLCDALECFHELDCFGDVLAIAGPLLGHDRREGSAGAEGSINAASKEDEDDFNNPAVVKLRLAAYEGIGKAFPANAKATSASCLTEGVTLLTSALPRVTWKEQQAALKALRSVIQKSVLKEKPAEDAAKDGASAVAICLQLVLEPVCKCLAHARHTGVRQECLAILDMLVSRLRDDGDTNSLSEAHRTEVLNAIAVIVADDGNESMRSAATSLKNKL